MKAFNVTLRILLVLLLISPVLGVTGIFPAPTREMYNTDQAFAFIELIMNSAWYIAYTISAVFAITIALTIMNRMALAALLMLPITVNIVSFHTFLDGGLLTSGAIMGNVLALINVYFLWANRHHYKALFNAR